MNHRLARMRVFAVVSLLVLPFTIIIIFTAANLLIGACGNAALAQSQEDVPRVSSQPPPPTPPHFTATVLDTFKLPDNWDAPAAWEPRAISEDGTVYGEVMCQCFPDYHYLTFVSRPGVGTKHLLRTGSTNDEIRPIAAANDGVVLLNAWQRWPRDGVYVPGHGVTELNFIHPDLFFPYDMNNHHVFTGQVGVCPDCSAVTWDRQRGFRILAGPPDHSAFGINNLSTVVGTDDYTQYEWTLKVWHHDGTENEFVVPLLVGGTYGGMNIHDAIVGTAQRYDSQNIVRYGGWYWSEETGLIEIPFINNSGHVQDVFIYGISDDGWVLGEEDKYDQKNGYTPYWYLWRHDAGCFDLGDLYDWKGRFFAPAVYPYNMVMNGAGQIALTNYIQGDDGLCVVFLQPIK